MFVKTINGEVVKYPYNVMDLRRDHPNISFPNKISHEVMAQFGVFPVEQGPIPSYDPLTERVQLSSEPILQDGKWILTKNVVALTADEISQRTEAMSRKVRAQRDQKLQETDWIVTKAYERRENVSSDWVDYRQALRDVPTQTGFPYDISWPEKP